MALEREYATKLQLLVKKAADKKAKMEQSIAVGSEPSKAWDANTLKSRCVSLLLWALAIRQVVSLTSATSCSTLNVAYDEIIGSMARTAEDHLSIADAVNTQVVDVLRIVERRNDETKKKVHHCSSARRRPLILPLPGTRIFQQITSGQGSHIR